jgi:RNase P subunit RPR2
MSWLKERALELMEEARRLTLEGRYELSRRYVRLALLYVAKGRTRLPPDLRRAYCRRCMIPLIVGVTESRRVKRKTLIRRCTLCGWVRRYELRREAKGGQERGSKGHSGEERPN